MMGDLQHGRTEMSVRPEQNTLGILLDVTGEQEAHSAVGQFQHERAVVLAAVLAIAPPLALRLVCGMGMEEVELHTIDDRPQVPFGHHILIDATLHRQRTGWKQRVGVVRVQIAPHCRHIGLGTAMVRELRHIGEKSALHYLMAEVIEEQAAAVRAFEKMGFVRGAMYRNFVNDQKGGLHNLLVLLYRMSSSTEDRDV